MINKEYVYFILCNPNDNYARNSNRYVKIGKSNSIEGIKKRLHQIQIGNPFKLTLLGYVEGTEKYFHSLFKEFRLHGEWFHYDFIREKIKNLHLNTFDKNNEAEPTYLELEARSDFDRDWDNKKIFRFLSRSIQKLFPNHDISFPTRRHGTTTDFFGKTIHVGSSYLNIKNPYDYQWNGIYLTVNSAYKIYVLFKEVINSRNEKLNLDLKDLDIETSLSNLKQLWKDDFNNTSFDKLTNNIYEFKPRG